MNHSSRLRLAPAATAGIVVLGLLGFPVGRYAPLAVIVAVCPLTMYFMNAGDEPRAHVRALPRFPPAAAPRRPGPSRRARRAVTPARG